MTWPCFLIEADRPVVEYLVLCPAKHRTVVEAMPGVKYEEAPDAPGEGWPTACPECLTALDFDADPNACFTIGGHIWVRPDTGEEHRHQHEFGPGAMYDMTEWATRTGSDGKAWAVVLPPGGMADFWPIDSQASSGGYWTRSGTPPNLTVVPSILTPRYHGFLTDGVLTDSLPDRPL